MNRDDLFEINDGSSGDVVDEILREYRAQRQDDPAEPETPPPPQPPVQEDQETYRDHGEYRSYDGNREYHSFDETLPDASPEEWYRYTPEDEELDEDYDPDGDYDDEDGPRRHPVLRAIGNVLLVICTLLAGFYLLVIYGNIPVLNDLRDTYVQTAMTTINHKWLATAIVPSDMIDDVMRERYASDDSMLGVVSDPNWGNVDVEELPEFATEDSAVESNDNALTPGSIASPTQEDQEGTTERPFDDPDEATFFEIFWELDRDSVEAYMYYHPEALANGWAGVDIDASGLSQDGTSIYTIYGDQVLAVNAVDGVMIARLYLSSNRSRGVLAICKDTSRLHLCAATTLGTIGQVAGTICDHNGGVLSMTGSAFYDPNGTGNGGILSGLAVCGGTVLGDRLGGSSKRIELRNDDRMYIVDSVSSVGSGTRDACEFQPALVVDGNVLKTTWNGPQPRAVLGQSRRLETMMVIIEGRLADSLGCGTEYVAEKLVEYGCAQAMNLDGGTSAIMYYKGKYITRCSNTALPGGRTLPTAWVYMPA